MMVKEKKKASQIIAVAVFLAFIIAVPLVSAVFDRREHHTESFYENRMLAEKPVLCVDSLLDGTYFSGWEDYLSDHIKARGAIIQLYTKLQLMLGKDVVNGVVIGDDMLFYDNPAGKTEELEAKAQTMAENQKRLSDFVSSCGGTYYYAGVVQQSNYYGSYYPESRAYQPEYYARVREALHSALDEKGINNIDFYGVYESEGFPREYYSDCDHHFTVFGALRTSEALIEKINETQGLGIHVPSADDYIVETQPYEFLGSLNRKLFGIWKSSYPLCTMELKEPVPYTRANYGTLTEPSVCSVIPKYGYVGYMAYMGGDYAETVIDTGRDELPSILYFGDSFTNAMEYLTYGCFNEMRSLDLRYYTEMSLYDYIEKYRPDIVVYVRADVSALSTSGNGDF